MTEEKAVTIYQEMNLQETERLGKILAQSKRFETADTISRAVVQVLAGRELGFGPIASMTGIYVIKGRVSISANMMAQAVKRSTKYDYRVAQMTKDVCEIAFFEQGKEIGRSQFTKDDAAKAGTQNMHKFARNMLFARAMSNGVKWFCPDVFQTGVYTPEELGAQVDGEGLVVEGDFTNEPTKEPAKIEVIKPPEPTEPEKSETVKEFLSRQESQPDYQNGEADYIEEPTQPPTPTQPGAHWIDDEDNRKKYFAFLGTRFDDGKKGITKERACELLEVTKMHDYTGTMADAMTAISKALLKR